MIERTVRIDFKKIKTRFSKRSELRHFDDMTLTLPKKKKPNKKTTKKHHTQKPSKN